MEIHPIIEDPSSEYEESGKGKDVPGLYGHEAMQRALCIDFDGVLHSYTSGWQGHNTIPDPPVEGAVEACYHLHNAGWKLYVLSSRSKLEPVQRWLAEHCFPPMTLTRVKPIAVAYIDDRAVRFEGNWPSVMRLFM